MEDPFRDVTVRRSLLGQALYDTFGQTGAKLGMIWIGTLAILAVLAPFLASSYPILLRLRGGTMTSPLLQSLEAIDVILLVLLLYSICVLAYRLPAGTTIACILWPLFTTSIPLLVIRYGPPLVRFRLYRPESLDGAGFTQSNALIWVGVIAIHLAAFGLLLVLLRLWWLATRHSVTIAKAKPLLAALSLLAIGASIAAAVLVRGPENPVYERIREQEKAGEVEFVVRTLIPYSPNDRLFDQPEQRLRPPDGTHWLGTTEYQEDMLSRMLHACRVTLAIGLIATSISTVLGVIIGGIMGYRAGFTDLIGMRLVEIVESIPQLVLLLIVTVSFGRSLYLMMVVIGLISWTSDARFIRAEFLRLRKLDFVQAAVAAGLGRTSILFRHMLPNGIPPVLVNASFGIAGAILSESVLSFLGLGLGAEDPSWGQLLEQARKGGTGFNWWIATFPGLAIFLTVFSYILIGEAMRDAIDPKLKKTH